MKTLHILNGDATFFVFEKTGIEGDVLVWREILSEGPVSTTDLWAIRKQWIYDTFGESIENYAQKVVHEAERLTQLADYDEILLWFEYDLVCQVNLIYILSVLNQNFNPAQQIYLICPDQFPGMPNFRGLGELNPAQLKQLLPSKIQLQQKDLAFAATAWDVYVENDPRKITAFLNHDFGNLFLLKKALNAHLLRFPKANSLNYIEETLLAIIKSGITEKSALYEAFWAKEPIFGMGDLQLDLVLNQLKEKGLY